jgi:hypothetical protein
MSEESVFNLLESKTFNTVDGRELEIQDYFSEDDFGIGENGEVFIKEAALLRVTKKLFTILERQVEVIKAPERQNEWCAVAVVHYHLNTKVSEEQTNPQRVYWSATADCRESNALQGFDKYTTTMAETRASARALRNILGLNLCSLEEVAIKIKAQKEEKAVNSRPADKTQLMVIERKFQTGNGITLAQMRNIIGVEFEKLEDLTFDQAAKLVSGLNKKLPKLIKENEKKK